MISRLAKYIEFKEISVRSFEMTIGASDGMIRRAIKNSTDIQCKWLTKIADNFHDISIDWLVTGKGQMIKAMDDLHSPAVKIAYQSDPRDTDLIAANKEVIETQRDLIASLKLRIKELEHRPMYARDKGLGSAPAVGLRSSDLGGHKTE